MGRRRFESGLGLSRRSAGMGIQACLKTRHPQGMRVRVSPSPPRGMVEPEDTPALRAGAQEHVSSNLTSPTLAVIAQLAERLIRNEQAPGPIPGDGSRLPSRPRSATWATNLSLPKAGKLRLGRTAGAAGLPKTDRWSGLAEV